jgi:sec-independent protein translocase protein TatB
MFDVGFSELLLIGVVALVVIGPERLPRVARTVGHLLGRLQRYVNDVKADINREMQLDELKRLQEQVAASARQLEQDIRLQGEQVRSEIAAPMQEQVAEVPSQLAGDEVTPAASAVPPAAAGLAGEVRATATDKASS